MPINILVPEVGESIVDARVAKWLKKAGDAVVAGEPLVELETDKVDVEVAAASSGVLQSIAHGDGADVKIGEILGTIEPSASGSSGSHASAEASAKAEVPGSSGSRSDRGSGTADQGPRNKDSGLSENSGPRTQDPGLLQKSTPPATPSARRLARESDVPLAKVAASGPRVTRGDVERAVKSAAHAAPAVPVDARVAPATRHETRERMSKRRATIARRLVEAQQTAALLTTFNEVDMSAVMALRERHKDAFKARHGVGLGIASFFVKAATAALREFPRLNAEIQGDEIVLKHYYDIGVAVGAAEGLVVPVLRDADRASFADIEMRIRDFAKRANDGTLGLNDLRGGTFSITNGGVYGSLMSTPIVNPPQVGILGLHAIKDRPVGVDDQIVLRPMMYTALTYDHRIVDGAEAVQFLVRIKALVEDPGGLLIQI
jgi:2-oxoglutarate dehydrogenase E2 component (dihydrolipoamide succinyltransferase)